MNRELTLDFLKCDIIILHDDTVPGASCIKIYITKFEVPNV